MSLKIKQFSFVRSSHSKPKRQQDTSKDIKRNIDGGKRDDALRQTEASQTMRNENHIKKTMQVRKEHRKARADAVYFKLSSN